jgi:branched-chain amino acid transport system permease protein
MLDRTWIAIGVAGAALFSVPFLHLPAFYESFLYLVLHWIVLATSWNLLSGYAGYVSFGHGAFFGAGVYATAVLAGTYNVPFLWTLPAAACVAALLGVALGAVAFRVRRVRGELFALLTLAVTFVLATIVQNTPIDGGPGVYLSAVPVPALTPTTSGTFYMLALVLAIASVAIARGITRARLGLGLFAIHDDEDVAEVMGVPTFRYKLVAFALSCALAGAAGGIHAVFVSYVTTSGTFNITVPLTVVLMSVLGGTRHWAGPLIGATAITILLYASTAADQAVVGKAVTGAILVAAVLFMPGGILGRRRLRPVGAGSGAAESAVPTVSTHLDVAMHTTARDASSAPVATRASDVVPHSVDDGGTVAAAIRTVTGGAPMLSIRGLRKAFKGVRALDGVDLDIREGEIVGVIGPNGSGKSTLINVVSGHFRADAGSLEFRGHDIAAWPAHRIARAGIARTYQVPRPFAQLDVHDNVALTAMFGAAALDRRGADAAAATWLAFAGLGRRARGLPGALNLHETKFLELARALAAAPRLLMLDEVVSGLTPGEIDEAVDLIRRIRDGGTTIVLVEHVVRIVTELSDRVVVLDQGRVLAQGSAADVMARDDVALAYLGIARA